ncbi:MAG: FKBP-type peptidyl-prolyl cis-trans isomerase [Bacteroidetes bacterium]|nr:FKBP-type peptidyl-prolyl cis-trans isomerase [Bacteroidota bacterium]
MKANQRLALVEEQQIRAFISRYGWKMNKTGTGLYYLIYRKGKGNQSQLNDIARIEYTASLLNGQRLYSSKEEGPMQVELGKGKVISGLEEGIFLMRVGDRAKFIIPSHLAFGLLGDQKRIPQRATLVYDVELTSLHR